VSTPQVQQAQLAFGARLRALRNDAGLTARALAAQCGWHFTKISKIEHGKQAPSDQDLRLWAITCGAADQIPDLITTARAIESMYVEWQRHMRAGLKRSQESSVPLYERTRLIRGYENTVIPGLFHTAEYAAAILEFWNDFLGLSSDIDEAIATRLARQQVIYTGNRRFAFVLEEQTLRTRVGGADVMAGQLDRLLAVMSLSRVSIGIIPAAGRRYCLAQGSFWIFDDERVQVEGVSAGLDITQPREVQQHVKAFGLLQKSAVYGQKARDLISAAIDETARQG
jgi:transcriptional regulator with XRE-family HTH domain